MRLPRHLGLALWLFLAAGLPNGEARAQDAPTPAEAARYQGLHAAAHAGDATRVAQLAAAGADLDARDAYGRTPLHVATFAKQRVAIEALAKAGAKLDLLESERYGHDGVVRQLIVAGAPLDHVNNLHWTAVIESIALGDGGPRHQRTLQALVAAKANLQLADRTGRTPLQLAQARGFQEMVRVLEAAGAR